MNVFEIRDGFGFVGPAESLDQAVRRVMAEKARITDVFVEQLYTFGAVDRDPRTRVITVAYYALFDPLRHGPAPQVGNGLELCRRAVAVHSLLRGWAARPR